MKRHWFFKQAAPVLLLMLGCHGAPAQQVTASAPPVSPQVLAQQVFGAMSHAIVEAVPSYYKEHLTSVFFYTAPELIYGSVCETQMIHARFDDPDVLKSFDMSNIYYAPETDTAVCSGPVANRKTFKAENAITAESALIVLKTVIAAAASDAPLAFAIENQCSDPKCAPEGLRPRLAHLQLQDLAVVRDIARRNADGSENRALEMHIRGGYDGHLLLQVVYQRNSDHKSPSPYEIRSVQMRWVNTLPPD